jgi:outer membrane protein assembly factor BamB
LILTKNGSHNFSLAGIFNLKSAKRKTFLIGLCLALLSCSRIVLKHEKISFIETWPQWGRDAGRSHFTAATVNMPMTLLWRRNASSAVGRSLIGIDDVVIYGTKDGRIESVNLRTGKKNGQIKIRGNFEATCAYHDSALLVLKRINQPTLQMVSIRTGKSIWTRLVQNSLCEPLIVGDDAYLITLRKKFECYNLRDGSRKWSLDLEALSLGGPAFADSILVLGDDQGNVTAFNQSSQLMWKIKIGGAVVTAPAISQGTVYFGALDDCFYALDLKTGAEKWRYQTGGKLYNSAAVNADCVVFGCTDHLVYCLQKATGMLRWSFQAGGVLSTAPLILDNVIFIGCLDKKFYALNPDNGEKLWDYETAGRIRTDPIFIRGRVLVASEDNDLYCFSSK